MTTPRVRAPELAGRGWLNTGGRTPRLADLRGRIVVLDFWTFCCINCLHVLDELRPIEDRYAAATCDVASERSSEASDAVGIAGSPNPACHLTRQDWGVPVTVEPGGATRLPLILRGLDPDAGAAASG
jgi:hypothetical protein